MDALPMQDLGSLDDLLDRAARGTRAGAALDMVKDELTAMRDQKYREMLNEPDDQKANLIRHDLKAIERLAKALLVKEAQGDVSFQLLQQIAGSKEPPEEKPLRVERVARKRPRRSSGQAGR